MTALGPALFGSAIVLSFVLTRVVRDIAVERGWVVAASSARHIHNKAVPRLGGVALYATLICLLGGYVSYCKLFQVAPEFDLRRLGVIAASASMIFALGLADDIWQLSAYFKFSVQLIAGSILFLGGVKIHVFALFTRGHRLGEIASYALTLFWVVWITNAFNLIDGLDGLAAGSALFSVFAVSAIAILTHQSMVFVIMVTLAGAILGFLRFNFNPASIFLGDCGSLFIGFLLSALSIAGTSKASTAVAIGIPVVSFGLPIADTLLAIFRRVFNGRPIFSADREHIHHKLLKNGLSHRQVVLILYAVSAFYGLLSLISLYPSGLSIGVILGGLGLTVWLCVSKLGYIEFKEIQRLALRSFDQKVIIKNNLALRRATAALQTCGSNSEMVAILDGMFEEHEFDQVIVCAPRMNLEHGPEFLTKGKDEVVYSWLRFENPRPITGGATWALVVDLTDELGQHVGSLELTRFRSAGSSYIDVNMLINGDFPSVLSHCLNALMVRAVGFPDAFAKPHVISAGDRG